MGTSYFSYFFEEPKIATYVCGLKYEVSMQKTPSRIYFASRNFGDLITADHKVFNEEGESRNNHRYTAVVQDFAT